MIQADMMMYEILDHACPMHEAEHGWDVYRIETHCVAFEIVARKTRIPGPGTPRVWQIRSYTAEDC